MTPKLVAAVALCAVGVWFSAATASPIGLFCVPIGALIILDLLEPLGEPKLSFKRVLTPPRALVDEEVVVEVRVENMGGALRRLEVWDEPPPGCEVVKGSTTLFCTLAQGEAATLRYTVRCRVVGSYVFEGVSFRASSLFGFAEERGQASLKGELRVYPRLLHRRLEVGWAKTLSYVGLSPSKRGGGRSEFIEIRGYVPGDPLDSVNWKAYARTGRPQVNVWSSERGLDCVVVVDLHASDVQRLGWWSAKNPIACCAYELGWALLHAGNRVGLVVLGSMLLKLQPAFGVRQLRRIVEALVSVEEGSSWDAGNVDWILQVFFNQQYRERRGVLFFVTSYPSGDVLDSLRTLSAKGFKTILIYVDTLEEELAELSRLKLAREGELRVGERVARAEVEWFERQAATASTVVEWSPKRGFRVVYT